MSRSMILETMYEVIKDSTEWGVSCEDGSYGEYVDGVVAMTEAMLEKEKLLLDSVKLTVKDEDIALLKAKEYVNADFHAYVDAGRA